MAIGVSFFLVYSKAKIQADRLHDKPISVRCQVRYTLSHMSWSGAKRLGHKVYRVQFTTPAKAMPRLWANGKVKHTHPNASQINHILDGIADRAVMLHAQYIAAGTFAAESDYINVNFNKCVKIICKTIANAILLHLPLSHNKPKSSTNVHTCQKLTQLMIAQNQRNLLLLRVKPGDYHAAAQIYHALTGRRIYPRYLQKFLKGERKVTGRKKEGHDPLKMYEAMAEAIKNRGEKEALLAESAAQIYKEKLIQKITGDLSPSPIAQ